MRCRLSPEGLFKCNLDGASKSNPGPNKSAFCIRNHEVEFLYVEIKGCGNITRLEVKTIALKSGLKYCISHSLLLVVLYTDFFTHKKVLYSVDKVPWSIGGEIRRIHNLRENIEVEHMYREENNMANFLYI